MVSISGWLTCSSAGKESVCNVENLGSIPGLGRSPGDWKGYPLQYSGPENSTDCLVHGVTKSPRGLSDFHFLPLFNLPLRNYVSQHVSCFPGGAGGKEPACQCRRLETQVPSLGWGNPLEEGMAIQSSILA